MKSIKMMGLLAVTASMIGFAQAQETKPIGASMRLGIFYPAESQAQAAGKSWFSYGFDYKLGDLKYGGTGYSASFGLSVDFFNKGGFRSVPVNLNYIGRVDKYYYFAGAGVNFGKVRDGSTFESKTAFGYQLGMGYEFSKMQMPLFAEVKWIGSSESQLAGWGVFAGIRF
jgi:hypothetical protein